MVESLIPHHCTNLKINTTERTRCGFLGFWKDLIIMILPKSFELLRPRYHTKESNGNLCNAFGTRHLCHGESFQCMLNWTCGQHQKVLKLKEGNIRCSFLNVPHLKNSQNWRFNHSISYRYGKYLWEYHSRSGKGHRNHTEDMTWSVLEKAYQENAPVPGRLLNAIPQGFSVGLGGLIGTLPKAHLCRRNYSKKKNGKIWFVHT